MVKKDDKTATPSKAVKDTRTTAGLVNECVIQDKIFSRASTQTREAFPGLSIIKERTSKGECKPHGAKMANVEATFSTRPPKVKDNARGYEKPPNEWFNSNSEVEPVFNTKLVMNIDYNE